MNMVIREGGHPRDWSSSVQVVREINRRAGTEFEPMPVHNPNGHGASQEGGSVNNCYAEHVQELFNETTLKNIARQYAADVLNFGYM
jgi:hypothetical protein